MADYINREAVRNELYDADAITMKGVAILNNFPSADVVELVHSRWVDIPSLFGLPWMVLCEHCGFSQDYKQNYCPNCGAKMDGGNDDG